MAKGQRAEDGATRRSPNGYHYTKVNGEWILTHRLTAEKMLGRPLKPNERVTFKQGFGREKDYDNPEALVVNIMSTGSKAARRARLEAKLEAIKAELAELD